MFIKHKTRIKYYCVFYFKQHLLTHFSMRPKLTIANGYLWLKINTGYIRDFLIFPKYVDMGIKRSVLQSLIQRSKRFVKIFKNMRYIKVENIWKITRTRLFFIFFCKTVFSVEYGFKIRMFWCPHRHILRRKKHLLAFLSQKGICYGKFWF